MSSEKSSLIKSQPQPQVVVGQLSETDYQTGFFDCFSPFGDACYVCCCPNCAMATARSEYDGSNWCFNCCSLTPSALRNIVREGYRIRGDCCTDILAGACCHCCTTLQTMKEVRVRGAPLSKRTTTTQGQQWSNGLFNCMANTNNCLYGCCCPTCAIASARTRFDNSNTCFNCLCITPALTRNVVREGYGLDGDCCQDLLLSCLCLQLVACQMLNEVDSRGPGSAVLG